MLFEGVAGTLQPLLIMADWIACTLPSATATWPSLSPPKVEDIGTPISTWSKPRRKVKTPQKSNSQNS